MNISPQRQSIDSLYVLKFLAACSIILIHVPTIKVLLPISRLGVPCFFMISGYFLYDQEHFINTEKVKKVLKKIAIITLKIHIIYFIIVTLLNFLYDGDCRIKWNDWIFDAKVIFYGESTPFYIYNNIVFWYLTAYIETLLIFYYFKSKGWVKALDYLIPIGLIANLVLGRYSFLFGGPYNYVLRSNFLTMGIPFVLLGMKLKGSSFLSTYMQNTSNKKILIFTICALLISAVEYFIQSKILHLKQMGDLNVFTIPAAVGVMMLALKNQKVHPNAQILVWLGKFCSMNIYLYHILIYFFINFLYLSHYPIPKKINSYSGILILTIIFSLFLHYLKVLIPKRESNSNSLKK